MKSFSLRRSLLLAALAPAFAIAAQSPAPLRAEFVDPAKPEVAAIRQAGEAAVAAVGKKLVTALNTALAAGGPEAAVLVTGGGLAFYDPKMDAMAVSWSAAGLAIGKAAQHKAVGVLHQRLARENIYVGEVVVLGMVKGTAFDAGNATLEAASIAEKFWELYGARKEASVRIS